MIRKIIGKMVSFVYSPNKYMKYNKKYKDCKIGDWTYGFPTVHLGRTHGTLHMGKYCSIGPKVEFVLVGDHRTDFVTTFPFQVLFPQFKNIKGYPKDRGDIIVGNDVWLCYGATVLSGVKIGDGAVIGMNALVTKDVPPYAIVGGNPFKVIRYRFEKEIIDRLLKIKWWDWPHEEVLKAAPLLSSERMDEFLQYAEKKVTIR